MSEATVVTSENLAEFVAEKMGLTAPEAPKAAEPPANEQNAAETPADETPPKPIDTEASKAEETEEDGRKRKASERYQQLANENRSLREKQMQLERERADLQAKLSPPEPVVSEKPDPAKYDDIEKFTEDVARWARQEAQRESAKDMAQQEAQQRQQTWSERVIATRKEIPDFDEVVGNSPVAVNDGIRDALLRSKFGPKLLYELANDPAVAEKLNKMNPYEALMELGAMSVRQTTPKVAVAGKTSIAAMSNTPAPITPIRGGGSNTVPVEDGKFTGTYAQYKEARQKGLIK